VGRPREHDDETRVALRRAAERVVAARGPAGFSVRAVAEEAGTTTRAVYTLFGSGDGLLVDALAQEAFEFLADEIEKLVETDDPAGDLVAVGVLVFRRLVTEHPALYRIAFQRIVRNLRPGPELTAARERAFRALLGKVQRLGDAGGLGAKPVREAAVEFNAMMEGLGNAELRGGVFRNLPEGDEERAWQGALTSLVNGFAAPQAA
jgi:AcrR family transcriptional regulator